MKTKRAALGILLTLALGLSQFSSIVTYADGMPAEKQQEESLNEEAADSAAGTEQSDEKPPDDGTGNTESTDVTEPGDGTESTDETQPGTGSESGDGTQPDSGSGDTDGTDESQPEGRSDGAENPDDETEAEGSDDKLEDNITQPKRADNEKLYRGYKKEIPGGYVWPLYVQDDDGEKVAYCFNAREAWPPAWTDNVEWLEQNGYLYRKIENVSESQMIEHADHAAANAAYYVKRTIYNGYPYNYSGIKQAYGLDNMQFRAVTQAAIWRYTDQKSLDASITTLTYTMDNVQRYVWTSNMSAAYWALTGDQAFSPPDTFQLDLFIARCREYNYGSTRIQNLLSVKMADVPEEIPDPVKIDIPVQKKWEGSPGQDITVRLYADGIEKQSAVLNEENGWKYTFEDMDEHIFGNKINYTITEDPVPGYHSEIAGNAEDGFIVTNTELTDIPVTKEWIGGRKTPVTVRLYADGKEKETVVLSEQNNWRHVFKEFPKYNGGEEISYTLKEDPVYGYEAKITGNADAGFTVRNISTATISVSLEKHWVGKAGEKAEIILNADGKPYRTAELSEETGWKYEFTGLPKYDDITGTLIRYTVEEKPQEGYSSVVTGDQQKGFVVTNTITGKVSVGVTKEWVGAAKGSAQVSLFADGKKLQTQTLNAGNDWQYTFRNLEKYDNGREIVYTVEEQEIPGYRSEITGNAADGYTIRNINTATISISLEKRWVGEPGEKAKFILNADGREYRSVELGEETGWKYEFTGLPKYDEETGKEIQYTLEEEPQEGYNSVITGDQQKGFVVTNTITGKVSVGVTKKWAGAAGGSVKVNLMADGEKVQSQVLNEGNNWQYTFRDLEKYNNGKEIIYTVEEEEIPGYRTEITGDASVGYMIRNISTATISIPIEKRWAGKEGEKARFTLSANGEEYLSVELNEKDEWKYTFTGLPKYDPVTGKEIRYTLKEHPQAGYNSVVTGDQYKGFTATNTITGKVSVGVTKEWTGAGKDSVKVNLLADGKKVQTQVLNEGNNWQYTFRDLEKYNNGQEIAYTVEEEEIPGYRTEITGNASRGYIIQNINTATISIPVEKYWIGKAGEKARITLIADGEDYLSVELDEEDNWRYIFTSLPKYNETTGKEIQYTLKEEPQEGYNSVITGDQKKGFKVTNTITGKVSVGVTKKWVGAAGASVQVNLLADGEKVQTQILNEGNNWQYTFRDLEKYNNGKEIIYTVEEEEIPGYRTEITGDVSRGYTIRNISTATISIPIEKRWVGEAGQKARFTLSANGREYLSVELNAKDDWKYTFTDLPKYDGVTGKEIRYTLEEEPQEGYISTITGDQYNGFTATNTITGKVSVGVTKEWIGAEKDSVKVNLLADGEKVQTQVLSKENSWQHTFCDLEKYNNGKEIVYTVEEEEIPGYRTEIIGDASGGYIIRNINTAVISIPLEKIWVGGEEKKAVFTLSADGEEYLSVELDKKDNWKYTFTDLPKYNETTGKEIAYTIEEKPVKGYRTEITGNMSKGFTVKNISSKVKYPTDKVSGNSAKTGDENHAGGWGILLLTSAAAAIFMLKGKKRQ